MGSQETDVDAALIELARQAISQCTNDASLADAKARFLGKDGELTVQMKSLGKLSAQERGPAGKRLNQTKKAIEALLNQREAGISAALLSARLAEEAIDVSLPGRGASGGGLHPLTIAIARIEKIFRSI
ncbi:MAG: phenylalanine--tRNA ligase subunit alpha, partial [Burkholderiaceae bacterium]